MTKVKITITDTDDTVLESFTVESIGESEETLARRVADCVDTEFGAEDE